MGYTPVNVFPPQVSRIPIAGPVPFNTLVCCTSGGAVTLPGAGPGHVTRGQVTATSNFVLAGFNQRVPPQFEHSTCAWLARISPADDSEWLYAVDSIAGAGFDPVTGAFFVNLNLAVESAPVPSQFQHDVVQFFYDMYVCSYVLVNEPPLSPAGTQQVKPIADRVEASQGFVIPSAATRAPSAVFVPQGTMLGTHLRVLSDIPPVPNVPCKCECECCRKRKCVRQKCQIKGCRCTCSCCQP
jgi:hypothetical protein